MKIFRPAFFLLSSLLFAASALAQSDIFVSKNGPPDTTAGSNITYTIMVGDTGPDATSPAVNMTDAIPAGLTFVSLNQSGPDTFVCSTPTVGTNGTVSCDAASMNLNDVQTFTLVVAVPGNAANGTTYINTATVSSSNDFNSENDSSTVGTSTPSNDADVAIAKNGPSAAAPDTDVTYTITLTNFGPADAQSVSWTDTLPNSVPAGLPMTFVSFNQTSGPTFNCGSPSTTVTCTLQTFPAGSTATFQFVGHVPPATNGRTYTNVASQTTSNDPNPENDSSSTTLTVSSTDVGVSKSAPATGSAGGTISYTITLSNGGPDTADNPFFSDALSSYETFVSAVQNSGPSGTCTAPPQSGGTYSPGGTVTCGTSLLGNGQSAQWTITVAVSPSTPNGTVITNTANSSSSSFDTNPNNNSSSASTTISANADLMVSKNGPATANAGTNISYTIGVTNNGTADASSVSLTDTLPAGTTFVSFQQNSGPTFNCITGATVTCSIATLTAGSSASFTLTVATSAGATGSISNTANVTSTTPDSNTVNNSSTATTTITTSADLAVSKTGPATVTAGNNVAYTITMTNNGPSDASSVSLTDALPAGTTFVSMQQNSGPTFNCTTGATVTCTIASLPAASSASFTLTVATSSGASGGSITNTANVTSTTPDSNPANNSSPATTTVTTGADLSVVKNGPTGPVATGYNVVYDISVANGGPSDAASVTLTDVLPAGTTFVSMTQTSGPAFNCSGTTTVTCTIGTLVNGATAAFQLTVQDNSAIGTTLSNTATITSTTPDPNPANNTSSSPSALVDATIPLLSPSMLMLLALALSAGAWMAMKKMG